MAIRRTPTGHTFVDVVIVGANPIDSEYKDRNAEEKTKQHPDSLK